MGFGSISRGNTTINNSGGGGVTETDVSPFTGKWMHIDAVDITFDATLIKVGRIVMLQVSNFWPHSGTPIPGGEDRYIRFDIPAGYRADGYVDGITTYGEGVILWQFANDSNEVLIFKQNPSGSFAFGDGVVWGAGENPFFEGFCLHWIAAS